MLKMTRSARDPRVSKDRKRPARQPRVRASRGAVWLGAATVVLVAAGATLTVLAIDMRDGPAASNRALTDAAATRQVAAAVSTDLEDVFSYTYTDLQSSKLEAQAVLAGSAVRQYNELFPELHNAVSQQLTVITHVTHAGVTSLSGHTAQLLIFMNQTASRGLAPINATPYHAQLVVTAVWRRGQWRIVDIASR
ncbi:MAG: hypothetical protein J2P28_00475 [Actinobacteria bacterium]|nr:hypothetical protein [Actinomycetota bacterium]MBO0830746.1 hypothetical protein [Actinomycetota bacterium]MBO0833975.1 hypothetical protein [Actinomycetota bacterium]